jgi:hypothetical protein
MEITSAASTLSVSKFNKDAKLPKAPLPEKVKEPELLDELFAERLLPKYSFTSLTSFALFFATPCLLVEQLPIVLYTVINIQLINMRTILAI